jgi:hypothetical protein
MMNSKLPKEQILKPPQTLQMLQLLHQPMMQLLIVLSKLQLVQVKVPARQPLHPQVRLTLLKPTRLIPKMPRTPLRVLNRLQRIQARMTTLRQPLPQVRLTQLRPTRLSQKMLHIQLTMPNKPRRIQVKLTARQVLHLQARRTQLKLRFKENRQT